MIRAFAVAVAMASGLIGFANMGAATADEHRVAVVARNGRTLLGAVDDRTDAARLWVRSEEAGVVLAASVAWVDVESAIVDGQRVSPQMLIEHLDQLASAEPAIFHQPIANHRQAPTRAVSTESKRPKVRNLEIVAACLANFDRDVEPDGLLASVAALDQRGLPVAVRGSLTAQLVGERRPAAVSQVTFATLDRWSQAVAASDFVDGVATFELRFRQAAPEWEFDLLPDALVEVRLSAFGIGNFAASAPVAVRAFNPLRDNRQLLHRTRFMPQELHGRNPHSFPANSDGRWLHWTW